MISAIKLKIQDFTADRTFSEILTGSTWVLAVRIMSTVFGFLISVILARHFGAGAVGTVAFINSMILLITTFTVAGTNTSILTLVPEHLVKYSPTSAFKVFRQTQSIVFSTSTIATIALLLSAGWVSSHILSKPQYKLYLVLTAIFIIFKSISLLNTVAVRALKYIRLFAVLQSVPTLSNLIILVLLMLVLPGLNHVPVIAFLVSLVVTGIASMVVIDVVFKRIIRADDPVHAIPISAVAAVSWPMFMTASMVFIIAQTGILMLGLFRSEAEVGYFAISIKLSMLTSFVIGAINSIAAPRFSELYHSNSHAELFNVAKKSSKLIFWATVPILLLLVALGKPLLGYVFGANFAAAYPSLLVLTAGQFINSSCGCTGIFMNMTGREKIFRNIVIIAAAINIALNVTLIPQLGILGSAIASAVSIAFWNITTLVYIKVKFDRVIGYFPLFSEGSVFKHPTS